MTAPIPRDIPDLPAIPLPGTSTLLSSTVPATAVMTPVRRPLAAVFRLLTALTAATAVTIVLLLGDPALVLSDFTVQSTLLLTPVLAVSARRAWKARRPLPGALTGAALLYVVIGALVHHLLLDNAASPFAAPAPAAAPTARSGTAAHHILHTVVPAAAVLDWLLLSVPGRLHLRQASAWLLYPLAYLAFSLARGELPLPGTPPRYLYPFLDVARHGYKDVLGNALLLGLSFYALAVLLVALDHVRPNPIRHRAKTGFRLQPPVG
ncbi:Pr6Pr family membrane protein [Streptomyces sp. NPDC085946]|uniref:Pr6Pr family membrane protein n=1 Tax=Streptomyces sp. NPDC085946 TaxID=3365744 RepID=UPI0037D98EBD